MERQSVIYLDNCVFSKMLEPEYDFLRQEFSKIPHLLAFSDVHVFEMKDRAEESAKLLDELGAVFVRNPSAPNNYHPISCLDQGEPHLRFKQHDYIATLEVFESMLSPMHHLLGGRREENLQEIAVAVGEKVKLHAQSLFAPLKGEIPELDLTSLYQRIDETTKEMAGLSLDDGWRQINDGIALARRGDPARHMDSEQKARYFISRLDPTAREQFEEMFPFGFARKCSLKNGEVAGLAFALFSAGLARRRGIFSGKKQERKFSAQFRDALHIEEASRCDFFVTLDQGAAELASASFAYAGFPTVTICLQLT